MPGNPFDRWLDSWGKRPPPPPPPPSPPLPGKVEPVPSDKQLYVRAIVERDREIDRLHRRIVELEMMIANWRDDGH